MMEMLFYSHINPHGIYTVCFGILLVGLNTTFSHFFMYISQNIWSLKFGLKSSTPIGRHVYEPGSTCWALWLRLRSSGMVANAKQNRPVSKIYLKLAAG